MVTQQSMPGESSSISPSIHSINNRSGTRLALSFFSANNTRWDESDEIHSTESVTPSASRTPVLLTHGTFSNHRSCRGLATYLAKRGFDCWILDMQGHGHSDGPSAQPTFESMCLEDTEAALEYVCKQYPKQKVHWVGHSGGGLAIMMYLARNPQTQSQVGKLVTLASQATHAAEKPLHRLAIKLSDQITKILNFAPGRWLKIGPENEFAPVMRQWYDWSLTGRWQGSDGFNYLSGVQNIRLPLLSLAGAGDKFIAPVEGCRHLHNACGSDQKVFHFCSTDTGYRENYSHARIISSSSAAREIWPLIADWLQTEIN